MKYLVLSIVLALLGGNIQAQCWDVNGIGDFEQANLSDDFFSGDQGNGTISLTSSEKNSGNQSLKVDVTTQGTWQVRIANHSSCDFNITPKESFTVSFYLKGEIGDIVNVSIVDDITVDQEVDVSITSTNWTLYHVSFQATSTSTEGLLKFAFVDIGTYYLDDVSINTYDCNETINGSASFDDCGICSGGTTGRTVINSCTYQTIDPTNSNFVFEGVLESDITTSKATFYRMQKAYVSTSVSGYYNQQKAAASSGICILFKTSSPIVKAYFYENLTLGSDVYWHTFDIYKNGKYHSSEQGFDIELSNPEGLSTEWKITLPTYSTIEFLKLEIIDSFTLETVTNTNKPVYIAIGNSITQGTGISAHSTKLGYPFIVADSLGYELYNWAIGGSKVYDGILSNLSTSISPSLVTILWGYNDLHYSTDDSYFQNNTFPQYEKILETFAQNYPDACIMAVLPTITTNPTNGTIRTIDSLQAGQLEIIKLLQSTYSNISYMYGSDYTDISGLNDAVHLNEYGNSTLANGIINELPCGAPTRISESTINSLSIHPNPTSNIIRWKTIENFQLLDVNGKLLLEGKGNSINISTLANGVYFLQINNASSKVIKK